MWRGAKVAVIVPAYQEERIIGRMLGKLPPCVDQIYVVDDASTDGTAAQARGLGDPRITLLRHRENRGVGAAIVTGYERALADGSDLLVVMAADDQMDPDDLPPLLDAVRGGVADYAKGNRFIHPDVVRMPRRRRLGSMFLSALTRSATSLQVDDCQCGFTVLTASAARRLPLSEMWPGYGYPNDILGMLADAGCEVAEVPVRAVYADEESGLRLHHVFTIAAVIARRWHRSQGARRCSFRGLARSVWPAPLSRRSGAALRLR
jgi:dolichol-phosphate mannosyltransferase